MAEVARIRVKAGALKGLSIGYTAARPEDDMSTLAVCFALWAWMVIFIAATAWFAVLPVIGILWLAGWL